MLTYLVKTTQELIMAGIVIGLIFAYARVKCYRPAGRVLMTGFIAGLAASVIMGHVKNTTDLIDTVKWNFGMFAISIAAYVLFLLLTARQLREDSGTARKGIVYFCLAAIIFVALFYVVPDVVGYPYTFHATEQTFLSTGFLYRLIGWALGIILSIVAGIAVNRCAGRADEKLLGTVAKLVLLVYSCRLASAGLQAMLARRIIKSNHTLFVIAKYTSNYSNVFIYAVMLLAAIIPAVLCIRSLHVNEPYSNPAQHRRIRIKWINIRKWSATIAVCFVLAVLNLTVVFAYDSRAVELSPVEDSIIEDDCVKVSLDQVSDGHLHRFAYVTENGKQIRFIVVKKTNGSSYGVGLDACDICGETGYYEKDGQVVCKLCDVVMNVNTIGFKGGCNPIVIDYSVSGGYISVPIEGLLEHESQFTGRIVVN